MDCPFFGATEEDLCFGKGEKWFSTGIASILPGCGEQILKHLSYCVCWGCFLAIVWFLGVLKAEQKEV